jgi:hypothetical protein
MDRRDVSSGLAFGAIGAVFIVGALDYEMGTARRMGPGYFPFMAGVAALLIAAAIFTPALLRRSTPPMLVQWRPMISVLAAIGAFAATIGPFGLLPAIAMTVVLAALADANSTARGTLGLVLALSLGSWLVFIVGLGLPIDAFKVP